MARQVQLVSSQQPQPDKNRLRYLVIHCSATPAGRDHTEHDIRRWHTSPPPAGRGWKQVGYSGIIRLDGKIVNLLPYNEDMKVDPWEVTNGVKGINSVSRHICYIGGTDRHLKPWDTRTPAQLEAMKGYVLNALRVYPGILIAGHTQFDPGKACPSFDVPKWCRSIGVPETSIYLGKK
jgi:N-acetylmuramoyl-L-alanine amidase